MPKLYFTDPGLAAHLAGVQSADDLCYHPLKGGLFESLIITEFLKFRLNRGKESNLYFWRDKLGHEIDCIIEYGGGILSRLRSSQAERQVPTFSKRLPTGTVSPGTIQIDPLWSMGVISPNAG